MATTKIWKVVKRMDHVINYTKNENKTKNIRLENEDKIEVYDLKDVIDYAKNSNKTEKQFYVTGINCDSDSAYEEMQDTKKYYKKEDRILAFHAYQSFKENEVTPSLAHRIGIQFAEEMWGDRFQVLVTTHLNTKHIHNHFVINSVSFKDGLKYYDNHTNYAKMRHLSDEICKEYCLNVIEEKITKKNINYNNFYKKSLYSDSYYNIAKKEIDLAISQAYSYNDFLYLMKKLNYEVIFRANKMSIRKNPYKRNIRIERAFGEEYSIENIKRRILEEQTIRIPFIENVYDNKKNNYYFTKSHKKAKEKGIIALYYHYCYLLKIFPQKISKIDYTEDMKADINRMDELSKEVKFLVNNNINTLNDLIEYKKNINIKISKLLSDREKLWREKKRSKDKNTISVEIINLTKEINKFKKEVVLCDDIKNRTKNINENLNELDKQEEQEKVTNDKKLKRKSKERKE